MGTPRSLHTPRRLCSVMNPVLQKIIHDDMAVTKEGRRRGPLSVVVEESSGDVGGGGVSRVLEGASVLLKQQLTQRPQSWTVGGSSSVREWGTTVNKLHHHRETERNNLYEHFLYKILSTFAGNQQSS